MLFRDIFSKLSSKELLQSAASSFAAIIFIFVSFGRALTMRLEPLEKYKDSKIGTNLDELLKKEIKSPS